MNMQQPFSGLIELITAVKNLVISANTINQTIAKVFPQTLGTTTSATAGTHTLPANPAGFISVVNPVTGATVQVPFYNP